MYEVPDIEKYAYTLQNNFPAGDIENLIYSINNEIKLRLMVYYDRNHAQIFGRGGVFYWDKYKDKVGMYYTPISQSTNLKRNGDIRNVMIHIGEGLADVLGFHSNTAYPIYAGSDLEIGGPGTYV